MADPASVPAVPGTGAPVTGLDEGRRCFVPAIETMPREEIDRHAEEVLLGDIVPWAYERSPLIRETWDAAGVTAADITVDGRLPREGARSSTRTRSAPSATVTTTRTAACSASTSTTRRCARSSRAIFSTSGTTGDPTPAPYAGRGPSLLVREFWELGCRPGDHFMHCLFTFRGPAHPRHHPRHRRDAGVRRPPARRRAPAVPPQPGAATDRLVHAVRPARPDDRARGRGARRRPRRGLLELPGRDLRRRAASGPAPAPRSRRGGSSCSSRPASATSARRPNAASTTAAHFWEDTAFVESLDPDGTEPVGDGERGELVSTTLLDKIAPLVRYRSDDLVRVTHEPCACGRTHGRVWPLGRKGDEVVVDGDVGAARRRVGRGRDASTRPPPGSSSSSASQREMPTPQGPRRVRDRGPQGARRPADRGSPTPIGAAVGVVPDVELVENSVLLRQGPPHKIPA